MRFRNAILVTVISGLGGSSFASGAAAQTPNSVPTVTAARSDAAAPAPAAGTLALVNNQAITLDDLDPQVRELVDNLDKKITEARRRALEEQIGALLLGAEAKKRKMTVAKLLDAEVTKRVAAPTEEEVKAFYDANRGQVGALDLAQARTLIINHIRDQRAQQLLSDLVAGLRKANPVVTGAGVGEPNLAPKTVLATVAGQTLTAEAFEERLKPVIYELRLKVYEAEKRALDLKINDVLLLAEAKRRGVPPEEIVRAEISNKLRPATDAEVAKFYEQNKARIQGDLESRRAEIGRYLDQQEQNRLELALSEKLRAGAAQVRVLLAEPVPPVQAISADDDPSRGDANAPVTVVVFTDFQCPACAAMHPVIDESLKAYGARVRLVVRDFPLDNHAQARKAAEAAAAAAVQGKFFEYAALLFKNQAALDVASLKKYASAVGLDRGRFDAALDGGTYAAEVSRDVEDGLQYGVDSTPTIFVGGVRLRELSDEALRRAVDRALETDGRPAGVAPKRAAR